MTLNKTPLIFAAMISLLAPYNAQAQEAQEAPPPEPPKGELKANFRRIGLDLSTTKVSHARNYQDSPVSQLNADDQSVLKGVFDFVLEYSKENLRWNNALFMEYGKTKIEPLDEPAKKTENADKILLSSTYSHKSMKFEAPEFGTIDFGPMASAEYQTEFTANDNAPRSRVFRGKGGLMLFDGKIIKDLYIAGVGEYDITYSKAHVSKFAGEIGWRIEHKIRDGVSFSTDGYYRRYFSYSRYVGTDLRYDFSLTARMDVDISKTLTFGPYLSYRRAHSRESDVAGSNFMIGVSFSYKNLFNL